MFRTATLIAAASLAIVPVSVSAQSTQDGYAATAEVRFDDLNLDSKAGQSTLNARVSAAVRKVCDVRHGVMPLSEQVDQRKCVIDANSQAQDAIGKRPSVIIAAR